MDRVHAGAILRGDPGQHAEHRFRQRPGVIHRQRAALDAEREIHHVVGDDEALRVRVFVLPEHIAIIR